ncbi:outer membrane protein OmpA-like peptidoglycan-associated protein [Roseibium hamelinense]|uniref:Outer membrane protein OmpA-like peptidoglycan-associated protein n=1 Tax=Roseibium hamelinense TaxID=150831 RepID=A0A562SNI2_9HYPH|nr:OmpA family protein [Roseibium hamelinense]MTI44332.1 OmpA family protein [Roseibium hamelinense]TWI82891.1 outer membrane protein OmpA-like peptidoglycan-associated protein [Roseibium hamelinense]
MRKTLSLAVFGAATFAMTAMGTAQTELSRNQIINSLQGAQTKVEISADELRRQAIEHINKYPGDNSTEVLPLSAKLAQLRQFNVEVTFDFDSARIKPESYETIGLMADALHTPYLMGQLFFVVGHTDAKGKREYNLELSQRRAEAIREALVTTFRVPPETLEAVGLGEEQLRDPANPDAEVNRRVQLINVGYP